MTGITVLLLLTGCMDTATRLWNGGPYISKKESLAFDQCYAEIRAQDPVMAKFNKTEAEDAEFITVDNIEELCVQIPQLKI